MGVRNVIMTIDNVFALFLIPLVAVWSDKDQDEDRPEDALHPRDPSPERDPLLGPALRGRALARPPPALIVALNVFKQGARGPVVALMPDIIPGQFRSEANGVINMAGAAAGIIATLALGPLMNPSISLPFLGPTTGKAPFIIAGVLVLASVVLLFAFVKDAESRRSAEGSAASPAGSARNAPPFWPRSGR